MARGRCEASGSGRGVGDGGGIRVPKARFIVRSPASFFMHRRCASFEKLDSNNATRFARQGSLHRKNFVEILPPVPHDVRRKVEQIKNHGEAVDVIRSLSAAWNHHEVMHVINPKVNTRCYVMPYRRKATNSIHRTSRGNCIPILRIG